MPLPALFTDPEAALAPQSGHVLYMGSSGTGKTQSLIAYARQHLRNPLTGFLAIDPDGEIAPACYDYLANPKQGLGWRTVHYLKPSSAAEAFALPLLYVPDRQPEACHNKAVRARTIFSQAITVGAGDYGPRLSKFFYLGCLGLALSGRPLVDLPDLFGRGARYLRELIGSIYPYPFLADEWTAIDLLTDRAFLEYRDPLVSRLMPIFGNPALRRVFGPQAPVDIAAILRKREAALLDLSGLEHDDAVLVGKAFLNLIYHEALQREPNREPHACVLLDEAFDYLTPDLARGFDRLRKRNIQLCIAIQRLSQIKKAPDDDAVATLSAIIANTRTKVVFRLAEPDDAEFMTRVLFAGFVPLSEWKVGSERPVGVGQHKEIVSNRSTAHHAADHEATSETESVAHGRARTLMASVTEADGESDTDAVSQASALGTIDADASSKAATSFDGISNSASMDPATGGLFLPPAVTSLGTGASNGTGMTTTASRSSGRSATDISGSSHARSTSRMTAVTEGIASTESEVRGRATARMRGRSSGVSESEGESDTFVTTYNWLPSQLYSLPEQLHRLAGEIQNLALRECFVKIDNAPPVRTRTADLEPAFKSAYFRRLMLPLFHAKAVARSPYLFPASQVDAQIAARRHEPAPPKTPEPDFSVPEPFADPVHDAPGYAAGFWKRKETPRDPPGRPPKGDLTPEHERFRVLDGGKAPDGDKEP